MTPDEFDTIEPPKKCPIMWLLLIAVILVFGSYFVGSFTGYVDGLATGTKSSMLQTKLMSNVCYRVGYAVGSDTNETDIAVLARVYRACHIGELNEH